MRDRLTSRVMLGKIEQQLIDRNSVLSQIGNTPLLRLNRFLPPGKAVEIYAKAEWFNPGGSVKDRPALNMLLEAERSGVLNKGKTIIDATSGNTGIAYALIGSVAGYNVTLALPANAGRERKDMMRAFGAHFLFTDPMEGTDGAQRKVKEIVCANPDQYYYPDQYNNPANWQSHYRTTAMEIWHQTAKRVTHVVVGLGTTGTFVGIARRLKEIKPSVQCIAVEPNAPLHGIEGLKHMATALVPGIYEPKLVDEHCTVSTDEAFAAARRLAKESGIFAGISSGAAFAAALNVASRITKGVVVAIFPDGGGRYGSEGFWNGGT